MSWPLDLVDAKSGKEKEVTKEATRPVAFLAFDELCDLQERFAGNASLIPSSRPGEP